MEKLKGKERKDYIKGAIAELKRVRREAPRLTYFEYQQFSRFPYKGEQIRERIGLTLNDIKKLAGIEIRTQRGKANDKMPSFKKTTKRRCNMEDINHDGEITWFDAVDNMHSCPKCTNIKLGEAYSAGLDGHYTREYAAL